MVDEVLPTAALGRPPLVADERDRASGVIVGAAVGDALGAPFEFLPAGAYDDRFPAPVLDGMAEMVGGGSFGWEPGEFTDDTQMGVALALTLLDRGGYDPDAIWAAWRTWCDTAADVGITTSEALASPDWRAVRHADPERTAANGALMRAFPLAVAFLHLDDQVVRAVTLHQASLTHPHPAAGWSAWLGVAAMREGVRGGDPVACVDAELARVPDPERPPFAEVLAADWSPARAPHGNGSAWVCLAQAVWALRTTSTFEDAVVAAVRLGDDADTVACVTGALAGARYGLGAIPPRWTAQVHGRLDTPTGERTLALAELEALGAALIGAPPPA
jgi:ADP-ribosyl-[dinitrogen reductase] hydrolase